MFDTQTLTVAPAAAVTLPKVVTQGMSSTYTTPDGALSETISHQPQRNGDVHTLVKVTQLKADPDPVGTTGKDLALAIHLKIERPATGFSATEVDALLQALKGQLTTAFVTRLYGRES